MELHPATLWEAISQAVPDRLAIVQGRIRRSWCGFEERSARLAGVLLDHGIGASAKVGQLLYNGPEYLEVYFAALKVRAAPFNVNYRYTADELAYLLTNADADALVYHASLAEVVSEALPRISSLKLLLEVDGGVGGGHVGGSLRYEECIAAASPAPRIDRDPDDVTMTYTGGTTGMPKGVVTRVGPTLANLLETVPPLMGHPPVALDDVPSFTAELDEVMISLPASPLMHATGLGIGVAPALVTGGTVVLLEGRRFDAVELWDTVAAERVNAITIVGDPFARPMLTALRQERPRDLTCVRSIASSGAMFSSEAKAGLLEHLPRAMIIDIIASTEGAMGMAISTAGAPTETGRFRPHPGVILVADDGRRIEAGSGEPGLIALPGGPEGYYKDDAKTAAIFKEIDGRRYTVPGDYATMNPDGSITLLGRGSSCINTAGEKVYPEEVEEALKSLPWVADVLVFGVADERFGEQVSAVLSRVPGTGLPVNEILARLRQKLAAYKVPRAVVVVDEVPRTHVGKPDYPAARALFDAGAHSDPLY
jgi:acyl-CoA synthetase (AMP-forming)/AMP-acid ligase II